METRAILDLARHFETAKVRYLIVGGYAVVAHGYVRFTADVDLVLDMGVANIQAAWDILNDLEYAPMVPVTADQLANPKIRSQWIREKGIMVLNFYHRKFPGNRVDIFLEEPFSFEPTYEKRYVVEWTDGTPLPFVDLKTLKDMKRAAGRSKDLLDLEQLDLLL